MTEDGGEFGDRLLARRRLTGLSQEELAERSGLNVRTIRNLERGRARWPYPDTVRRLADALDLHDAARDEFTAAAGRRLAHRAARAGRAEVTASASSGRLPLGAGSGPPTPRQLPPGVRHFTGRKAELDFLTSLLDAPGSPGGGTVVISAIGGMAGAGKTALAVHWAHQHADRFPDGQLYVNLHGFSSAGSPTTTATAARRFLDALEFPAARVPADTDAQLDLYRSLLAGKRMLIVLDNALDTSQVRPLLPGAARTRRMN